MNKNILLKRIHRPIFLGLSVLLAACGNDQEGGCRPDPASAAPAANVALQRLEKPFFQLKDVGEARQFIASHPLFSRLYLQVQPSNATPMANALAEMATNPDLNKLKNQTEAAFADSTALRRDMGAMFGRVKYYFPDFQLPTAYTYISGLLGKDMYVSDSLLVISLDWFAGPQASYRPDLPNYILRRYTPAHVLPQLALNVASKYNKHKLTANTALDAMVNGGKALYFAGQMLPCTPDSLLLGYSAQEMKGINANEGRVWGHFLEKDILYSTTPFLVQKYVGERPNVPEIDKTAPGRIGQWVGLQIIRKYMAEHPDVTLPELMKMDDAQKLLNDSHYRPNRQ